MRFSVITVSYNAEKTIKDTIESTLNQVYFDFEIIVKDGLSNDETISVIPKDSRINLVESKDQGIYDAMNQAINASQGEYLVFMNCGDKFANDKVLQHVDAFISRNPNTDIIYGNYFVGGEIYRQPEQLSNFYLYRTPLCHQSMIIRRKLFYKIGFYNTEYRILADYEFTQRAWWSKNIFEHVDIPICSYLGGGVSETEEGIKQKEIERRKILINFYPTKIRLKYDLILMASQRRLRIWLMNGNGPDWLRKLYRKVSNYMNS